MDIKVNHDTVELIIDSNIYNESVLFKAFYWYTGNGYQVSIKKAGKDDYNVLVSVPKGTTVTEEFIAKIKQDLINFKLRSIVAEETKTVRELIIAKAFAHYPIDIDPTTEVSDPIGFNPNSIL